MPSHEDVHYCPSCELRFKFRTELEDHLRRDHPDRTGLVDDGGLAGRPDSGST